MNSHFSKTASIVSQLYDRLSSTFDLSIHCHCCVFSWVNSWLICICCQAPCAFALFMFICVSCFILVNIVFCHFPHPTKFPFWLTDCLALMCFTCVVNPSCVSLIPFVFPLCLCQIVCFHGPVSCSSSCYPFLFIFIQFNIFLVFLLPLLLLGFGSSFCNVTNTTFKSL